MMEVLRFIFSDFWIWLGTLFLVTVIIYGLAACISAIKS